MFDGVSRHLRYGDDQRHRGVGFLALRRLRAAHRPAVIGACIYRSAGQQRICGHACAAAGRGVRGDHDGQQIMGTGVAVAGAFSLVRFRSTAPVPQRRSRDLSGNGHRPCGGWAIWDTRCWYADPGGGKRYSTASGLWRPASGRRIAPCTSPSRGLGLYRSVGRIAAAVCFDCELYRSRPTWAVCSGSRAGLTMRSAEGKRS